LEQIKLNKENPKLEFQLNAEDSYLLLQSASLSCHDNTGNPWTNFISKMQLTAEFNCIVYVDPEGRFAEDRKKQFPIHLVPDANQIQPEFYLNLMIKNETFTVGINPEIKHYKTLKLELHNLENLDEDCTLTLSIQKHKMDA
jgi:hypothetical protein